MAIWLALIVWEITYVLLLQAIVFCFALRFDFQFGVSTSLWLLVLVYIDKEISLKRTKSSNYFNRAWMNCRGWKSEIGIWRSGRDQRILAKDSLTRAFLLIHLSSKTILYKNDQSIPLLEWIWINWLLSAIESSEVSVRRPRSIRIWWSQQSELLSISLESLRRSKGSILWELLWLSSILWRVRWILRRIQWCYRSM